MTPYHAGPLATLLHGDVLETLAGLPAESVDVCITSPPYYGLRRYSGDQGEVPYGLEATPEAYIARTIEILRAIRRVLKPTGSLFLNLGDSYSGSWGNMSHEHSPKWPDGRPPQAGAYKPLDMCLIPEQVVLAARGHVTVSALQILALADKLAEAIVKQDWEAVEFVEMVLRAWGRMQAMADGWYVRQVIIWEKSNPMPESVQGWRFERCMVKVSGGKRGVELQRIGSFPERPQQDHNGKDFAPSSQWADCPGCPKCEANDGYVLRRGSGRPTSSFEYLYMLTPTSDYFYDTEAVREDAQYGRRPFFRSEGYIENRQKDPGMNYNPALPSGRDNPAAGRNRRNVWRIATQPFSLELCKDCKRIYDQKRFRRLKKNAENRRICRCGASDWLSHFATFPEKLVEPCILASTSAKGNCPECGMPWAMVVERTVGASTECPKTLASHEARGGSGIPVGTVGKSGGGRIDGNTQTIGWRPTCRCNAGEPVPAVVLDPFVGSGTTAIVAKKLGRASIGIDLSEDYLRLAAYRLERTEQPLPMALPPAEVGQASLHGPGRPKLPAVLSGQEALL